MVRFRIEREKFYPGPGIEPGSLALRASALPLRYPGELLIQGRINPYSAKGLGDQLYAILHKLPGEIDYSFYLFLEVVKLSSIHIRKPLHTFHSKGKAFTSEPRPYLLQAVSKITTLYNFYEWRV